MAENFPERKKKPFVASLRVSLKTFSTFVGTLFFYQFRGRLGIDFMNMMNYTAANIGTREFDASVEGLRDAISGMFPRRVRLQDCYGPAIYLLLLIIDLYSTFRSGVFRFLECKSQLNCRALALSNNQPL